MTPEQLAALFASPEFKTALGAIVAEQVKAAAPDTKALAEELAALRKSALTPESAKTLFAELAKPAPGKPSGQADPGKPDQNTAALEALQKRLDEAEAKAKAAERAAAVKARDTDLTAALTANGIRPEAIPDLLAALPARGLVIEQEDGSFGFKGLDQFGRDAVLPIADGVKGWAKSDAAAIYRPPVQAQGSGQQRATGTPQSGGKITSLAGLTQALGINI